ncbi:hypothetical protein Neosp_004389 [[Neocosmospora] mangrovei]
MAASAFVLARRQPLTVRLRVWHRSEYRRSYTNNQYLACILSRSNLYGWTVEAAQLDLESSSGEDFVPIEVNLHYEGDDLGFARATLRRVFIKTIESHIPKMFKKRQGKPLYVTMHPVGDDIPDGLRTTFTDFRILQSLEVESQAYVSSGSMTERDYVVKRADACIELLKSDKENGVLSEWLKGIGEQPSVVDGIVAKEVEALWNKSLASFWHVQLLSNQVQGCIENLSSRRTISDQDLLDNLVLMRRAVIHFSQYELCIEELTEPLLKMHGTDPYVVDNKVSILVGTAILFILPGFDPLSAFLSSAGGMKLTAFCQRLQKRRTVQHLGEAMKDFSNYLQEAQVALAAKFCNQVLQSRLESLSIAKRSNTLRWLGIDVDHLRVQQFSDDQIVKTLELFYASYQNFKAKRDKVRDDAGLREAITVGGMDIVW